MNYQDRKAKLAALQVGDEVTRMLTGTIPVGLKVTAIDDLIHCGPWTFHKLTGCEVDLEIGWDGLKTTGSFLVFKKDDHDQS